MSQEKVAESQTNLKNKKRGRRTDPGRRLQEYLGNSGSPEETLFKINELLHAGAIENTRKNPRAPISFPVEYQIENKNFSGSCYTLSQQGMFVRCITPPSVNSVLELLLHLPDGGEELKLEGQVIQAKSLNDAMKDAALSGMSVVFTRIRQEDRRRIEKLIKAWARRMKSKAR